MPVDKDTGSAGARPFRPAEPAWPWVPGRPGDQSGSRLARWDDQADPGSVPRVRWSLRSLLGRLYRRPRSKALLMHTPRVVPECSSSSAQPAELSEAEEQISACWGAQKQPDREQHVSSRVTQQSGALVSGDTGRHFWVTERTYASVAAAQSRRDRSTIALSRTRAPTTALATPSLPPGAGLFHTHRLASGSVARATASAVSAVTTASLIAPPVS